MSYTNQTANYGLPQYVADDKPTYLGDFNKAMLDIDTAIKANETVANSANTNATNANNSASEALSTATTAQTTASNADTKATNAYTMAETANTTANSADTKADTAISTANSASSEAQTATTTANTANATASSADTKADTAISTANSADTKADTALNRFNYSETETVVGTWIDGKPLYRKVYSQNSKDNIDLSSLNYDFINIVSTQMVLKGALVDPHDYIRDPYYSTSNDYFRVLIDANQYLKIETNASTIDNWLTILEYTKVSDPVPNN